jgi:hypothetical protein
VNLGGLAVVAAMLSSGCASHSTPTRAPNATTERGVEPTYAAWQHETPATEATPAPAQETPTAAATPASIHGDIFGDAGGTWWSVQGGSAFDGESVDANARLSLHRFLADDFEINGSLGGWAHMQEGEDQQSLAIDVGFRWHFLNRARERESGQGMTMYAETGIGMMYATGEVPDGGTDFNLTPRGGVGATWPIGDGPSRFDLGVRWQHFSNGSISGSDDNPSRDSGMVYVGFIFPF